MSNFPSIRDLKVLLDDELKNGARVEIANILGVTEAIISRRFNPNDDRKPYLFEGLRESHAVCMADSHAGAVLRSYIDGLFDSWLNPPIAGEASLSCLVCNVDKETGDLVRARLANLPAHEQLKEAREVKAVAEEVIRALEEQMRLREVVR